MALSCGSSNPASPPRTPSSNDSTARIDTKCSMPTCSTVSNRYGRSQRNGSVCTTSNALIAHWGSCHPAFIGSVKQDQKILASKCPLDGEDYNHIGLCRFRTSCLSCPLA